MRAQRLLPKFAMALSVAAMTASILAAPPSGDKPTAEKEKPKTTDKAKPKTPAKPRVLVTISKQTTYITEPLRPDGYPDYVAAINERAGRGVKPEDNAAVLVWKAIGPGWISEERRPEYFRMLGISQLPEKGDYYVDFSGYPGHVKETSDIPTEASARSDIWYEAERHPWSEAEFPLLAKWLAANEKPLALVTEASKRPQCYSPLVSTDGNVGVRLILDGRNQLLPLEAACRHIAKVFTVRAMFRLNEGQFDEAWQDIMSCHRLARLVGRGPLGLATSMALDIDRRSQIAERVMLGDGRLAPEQIAKMRDDLARLSPLPKLADAVDVGDRLVFLDFATTIARQGLLETLRQIGAREGTALDVAADLAARATVNWDEVLREGNTWYDRSAEVLRKSTRAERVRAGERLFEDIRALRNARHQTGRTPSEIMAGTVSILGMPQFLFNGQDGFAADSALTGGAFALAAYHAEHGSYPQTLGDLVPKYAAQTPKDVFNNDAELRYAREGDGYVLYSMGRNGKEDAAKGPVDYNIAAGWIQRDYDEFAIRVPGKK
ncbi:MAG: hypothetical protein ABFC96_03880 [Thermoguttaceae bacterium]